MMHRWQVVAVEGGKVRHVQAFKALKPAKKRADEIWAEMDHEGLDGVIIWDHALGKVIYNPQEGLDVYK